MKRKFFFILCIALVGSLAALAQSSPAAAAPAAAVNPTGGTKVGIISVQDAVSATNEGQRDLEALSKTLEPKRTELQKLQTEVQDLQKQLQTQGDKLNPDARTNLENSISQKQKVLQRDGQAFNEDAQSQQGEIFQRILQKMGPMIDKYAKENQYALIIDVSNPWPQGQVLWAGPSVDITKAIVDAYNAQSGVAAPARPATGGTAAPRTAPSAPSAPKPSAPTTTKPKPPGQ